MLLSDTRCHRVLFRVWCLKPMLITNWHICPLTVANQQQHIEQSEQLLSSIQPEDRPILYWSVADPTGLVLGFSQKHSILNPAALASLALPIYHRRAGGTAVLVGPHLLSLDVVLPAGHPLIHSDIVGSYHWVGAALGAALRPLWGQARRLPPSETHAQPTLPKQPQSGSYQLLLYR